MLSQASSKFTNIVLQCWQAFEIHGLARIRKDSQGIANGLSQGFIKDSQVRKSWFLARISNGHFADVPDAWLLPHNQQSISQSSDPNCGYLSILSTCAAAVAAAAAAARQCCFRCLGSLSSFPTSACAAALA